VKIVGIVGSPRKGGNTEDITRIALKEIETEGIETELISLAGKKIEGCRGCDSCHKPENTHICVIKDDFEPIYQKMAKAEGFILSTPVYFGSATPQMSAFISRCYAHGGSPSGMQLENKVGGPIVVARRAGKTFTFAQLLFFFMSTGVIVPGSVYWNLAFGWERGEVEKDEEGVAEVKAFAKRLAWLTKKVNA
jgi:multimeric flavodoxin WrbA